MSPGCVYGVFDEGAPWASLFRRMNRRSRLGSLMVSMLGKGAVELKTKRKKCSYRAKVQGARGCDRRDEQMGAHQNSSKGAGAAGEKTKVRAGSSGKSSTDKAVGDQGDADRLVG